MQLQTDGMMDFLHNLHQKPANENYPVKKAREKYKRAKTKKVPLEYVYIIFTPNKTVYKVMRNKEKALDKINWLNCKFKGEFTLSNRILS